MSDLESLTQIEFEQLLRIEDAVSSIFLETTEEDPRLVTIKYRVNLTQRAVDFAYGPSSESEDNDDKDKRVRRRSGQIHCSRGNPKTFRLETALLFLRKIGLTQVTIYMDHS